MTYRFSSHPDPCRRRAAPAPAALLAGAFLLAAMLASACASGGGGVAPEAGDGPTAAAGDTTGAIPDASPQAGAHTTADVAAPLPAVPPGPESAAGPVLCFYGPVTQTASGGEATVAADLVVRRTLEPEASRVVEETVRIERAANRRTRPYRTLYDVDGDRFVLREEGGAYAGTGTLEGEPWRWSAWDLDYSLESGIRVTGRYEIRPRETDGGSQPEHFVLVGEKTAYGPDGSEALRLHEELAQVTPERCAELMAP